MKRIVPAALFAAAALAAAPAMAHTGHDTNTLAAGLAHPLGLDHLLAMVAVGLWSAAALQGAQRLAGPALFMAALLGGAVAGAAGVGHALVEPAIAASVVVLGLMLAFARRLPASAGLLLVAVAGSLHGLAHGAELPAAGGFAGYALGFLAATALLHAIGLAAAPRLLALPAVVWRALSGGVALAGVLLLTRV
ncbi:urease accessory protein UreJ [Rubrivivax gelatinosus]|nr:urease accessory protein UreJ [Rubrivivax gelatinosus]